MRRVHLATIREGTQPAPPETARYLVSVLRLTDGAEVQVFGGGQEARAVLGVSPGGAVTLAVSAPTSTPARRPVTILYALSKGDKVDGVVRDATELGATRLVIFAAERRVVKLEDDRAAKRTQRWQKIAEEASRQCGRADPPEIVGPLPFAAALETMHSTRTWLLHPSAPMPLADGLEAALLSSDGVAFLIGPEGGFSQAELELAETHGVMAASFGTTTLRTETVPTAILGALAVLDRRTT